jgi:outer membrane receptor protein involved in Fe transport
VTRNGLQSTYDARVQQDVVSASLSGELFSLWGGPIALAMGAEYRKEKSVEDFDAATNAGETLGNFLSDTTGEFNVKEAFIEVVAPIVEDRPLIHYFGVEGAFRYADYSTVGGVESWKIGATYAPTRDLRLRAVYAEATRAPNIAELFARQSETFPAVIDPCDQREGEGDNAPITLATLPAACLAIPAINAAASTPGGFVYTTAQIQTINGFVGGNSNLTEETAQTLTIGGVFTPSFLPNFSMTVDYYRIKVKDAIGIIGQQTSLDECYTGSGAELFCNNIIRDNTGRIATVNALNLNTGSFLVSGIDVQAQFKTRIAPKTELAVSAFYNHRLKQEQTSFPGGPTQDEIGQLDCYICGRLGTGFKDKFTTSTTLDFQSFSLNWRMNYLGPVVDTLGEDAIKVGAFWYHDAQLRFKLDEERKFAFYLGVDNIFDKKPPLFNDTNPVTFPGTQTSANTYDLYGRMIYAGVDFKF